MTKQEIKEANSIGRVVAGGLLLGHVGTLLGALTAKDKKKTTLYMVISYTGNNAKNSIVLKDMNDIHGHRFYKRLREIVYPKEKMPKSNEPLEL